MMDILSKDPNMWTALAAIFQGIASIVAICALIDSIRKFTKSLQTSHYTELDSMYFELLKTALEHPCLHNQTATRSGAEMIKYDIYAFMVWNFIEAIYDRCERDNNLRDTWYPVVDTENRKHGQWFVHPDNRHKFKDAFHKFIEGGGI